MIVNLEHFIKKYNIKIDTTQQKYYYFEDITIDNILHKVFSRIYYLQNKNNIVNVGLNSIYFKMFIPALNKKRPRNKDYYEYRLSGENAFDICGITFVETNLTETYIVERESLVVRYCHNFSL